MIKRREVGKWHSVVVKGCRAGLGAPEKFEPAFVIIQTAECGLEDQTALHGIAAFEGLNTHCAQQMGVWFYDCNLVESISVVKEKREFLFFVVELFFATPLCLREVVHPGKRGDIFYEMRRRWRKITYKKSDLKISYKNIDLVVKEALTLFNNTTLDFLGLQLPKIIGIVETEIYKIETKNKYIDLNFSLEDGSILHIEEEIQVSKADLLRFAQTDLLLYGNQGRTIHTVVLTKTAKEKNEHTIQAGSLKYDIQIINLTEGDGERKWQLTQPRKI